MRATATWNAHASLTGVAFGAACLEGSSPGCLVWVCLCSVTQQSCLRTQPPEKRSTATQDSQDVRGTALHSSEGLTVT